MQSYYEVIMVRKNIPVNKKEKNLFTVGGRLAYERELKGLGVQDFAILCGVTKQTQIKYENGSNHPDTKYLSGCMAQNVDVMYVLTGRRSLEAMSDEHQNLIEAYEAAPDDLRRAAFAVLLSIWKKGYLDKPQKEPGYFQHQILGEDDMRYENFKKPTLLLAAEPNQEPPLDSSTSDKK